MGVHQGGGRSQHTVFLLHFLSWSQHTRAFFSEASICWLPVKSEASIQFFQGGWSQHTIFSGGSKPALKIFSIEASIPVKSEASIQFSQGGQSQLWNWLMYPHYYKGSFILLHQKEELTILYRHHFIFFVCNFFFEQIITFLNIIFQRIIHFSLWMRFKRFKRYNWQAHIFHIWAWLHFTILSNCIFLLYIR